MGLIQSTEGLNRTKRVTLLEHHQSFSGFRLKLKHESFLVLESTIFHTIVTASAFQVLRPLESDDNNISSSAS
jgi:hypothetical protein